MTTNSTWAALRNPAFRKLWIAAVISGTKVDRRKLVCTINVCLASTAFALAVLGWLHLLNPYLILVGVFFIGVGFAINAPS